MEIVGTRTPPHSPLSRAFAHTFDFAVDRCKVLWRAGAWKSAVWKTWANRARSKRKALAVRETAALGDRRFVCVIQFERQRFLVGSSPSSVTLLAQLPDESSSGQGSGKESGERD
jgi:Flagellar biosynthesis protein, FliO